MNIVGAYKVYEQAIMPTLATGQSACFDISACLVDGERISMVTSYNDALSRTVVDGRVSIFSGERALVPTGLIFDIPLGFSLRIHPRSGLSYRRGISLSNCEGVIDSDYVEQTFVSVINNSDVTFVLDHGDRIAQLELTRIEPTAFAHLNNAPTGKTGRSGGFGSTGLNT